MRHVLLALALSVSLVGACGDDDPDESAADSTTTTSSTTTTVEETSSGPQCEGDNDLTLAEDSDVDFILRELKTLQGVDADPAWPQTAVEEDAGILVAKAREVDRAGLCDNDISDLDNAIEVLEALAA